MWKGKGHEAAGGREGEGDETNWILNRSSAGKRFDSGIRFSFFTSLHVSKLLSPTTRLFFLSVSPVRVRRLTPSGPAAKRTRRSVLLRSPCVSPIYVAFY